VTTTQATAAGSPVDAARGRGNASTTAPWISNSSRSAAVGWRAGCGGCQRRRQALELSKMAFLMGAAPHHRPELRAWKKTAQQAVAT